MREEPFPLHRAAKGRDTTMKVPVLGLSLLVQRMLAAEAAKRAGAEAQVAGLRAKVKVWHMLHNAMTCMHHTLGVLDTRHLRCICNLWWRLGDRSWRCS